MTPLEQALDYAASGWPVFPCREAGPLRKRPYVARGFYAASRDPKIIGRWWRQWPEALIAVPTGAASGIVIADIDVKDPRANGFDSLEDHGIVLPETPMVHTSSGGLHCHFTNPARELKCSAGLIAPGVDARAVGGFAIVPSAGSGYYWDPVWNRDTVAPQPAPDWLWPHRPSRPPGKIPTFKPGDGLTAYGRAALEGACEAIAHAGPGLQEKTLNAECFSIGTLAAAAALPAGLALRTLLKAAAAMPDYDAAWPWRAEEIDFKVHRAFEAGQRSPRALRGRAA
jgi:Bifunctional DNA primase/polymerase, N-terminal